MDTKELVIKIIPFSEQECDIVIARLSDIGYDSFMINEDSVNAYISVDNYIERDLEFLNEKTETTEIQFSVNLIPDQNWNEIWEKNYFKPIEFGIKCVIRASFHPKFPDAEIEILIDPKTAFGTGNHSTTFLILEEILELDLKDKYVLDMGCGTGILAILSILRGAKTSLAVDNDPKACLNTYENIDANNVSGIEVLEGTTDSLKNQIFDVIYENIWKNTVTADLPILYKHLKHGGIVIVSGFYKTDVPEVQAAAEISGFKIEMIKEKNGWAIIKLVK